MKREPSAARVLLAGLAWRTFGTRRSGEVLLRVMRGGVEQNRMLAGMSLVKAGERSVDLIEQAVSAGDAGPGAIRLLADLESPRARALLERIAGEDGTERGEAARACLKQLERQAQFKRGG